MIKLEQKIQLVQEQIAYSGARSIPTGITHSPADPEKTTIKTGMYVLGDGTTIMLTFEKRVSDPDRELKLMRITVGETGNTAVDKLDWLKIEKTDVVDLDLLNPEASTKK